MENNFAISMQNVWVKYDGNVILEDIDLAIKKKELITIVGPNGGGKTTLLKTIMGFKEPCRGNVKVLGKSPKKILKSGKIGYLSQTNNFDSNFPVKVFDVVAMTRYSQKTILETLTKKDRQKINESLEKVEMEHLKTEHFGSLSGGQKQRVLIARALAIEPEILILDEPSTGLDVVAQDKFYKLLTKLRDSEDLTVIIVSHDIGAVSTFVDKIACLNKKLHFHGKLDECDAGEILEKVFGKNVNFLHHDKNCVTCGKNK
jgi:zinc transport system ATP-binding protein